jgi:hypothetical protein
MQMRRVVTFAMNLGFTLLAFGGIAWPSARDGIRTAIPARLTAQDGPAWPKPGGLKQVRFAGYTFRVPAGWPVYRLDRDPGQCVRYDRHAVYRTGSSTTWARTCAR